MAEHESLLTDKVRELEPEPEPEYNLTEHNLVLLGLNFSRFNFLKKEIKERERAL